MIALSLTAGAVITSPALAADFPSRAIRIIVPYGAGGTIDLMARMPGPKLQTLLGKPVIIDN
jgi:tripartite-type tricarboxylate transporter receptor subunit TctC